MKLKMLQIKKKGEEFEKNIIDITTFSFHKQICTR